MPAKAVHHTSTHYSEHWKIGIIDSRFVTVVSSLCVDYNHLSWTMCVESVEINGCQDNKHSNAVVPYKFAQCMEKVSWVEWALVYIHFSKGFHSLLLNWSGFFVENIRFYTENGLENPVGEKLYLWKKTHITHLSVK